MRPIEPHSFAEPAAFLGEDSGYAGNISSYERDAKKNTAGCVGTMTLIVTVICLIWLTNVASVQSRFARSGVTASATVTRKFRMRRSTLIHYRYEANGRQYLASASGGYGTSQIGDRIVIRFLPDEPTRTEIVGNEGYLAGYLCLLLVGAPMFLVTVGMAQRWLALNKTPLVIADTVLREDAPMPGPPLQRDAAHTAAEGKPAVSPPLPSMDDIALNELPSDRTK